MHYERTQLRYLQPDFLRGMAIVLMVCFHFCFDLNHFQLITIDIYHGLFWHYFRYLIVTLFLLCVGISLHLAHSEGINWRKGLKRLMILAAASLVVSVASYIIFPKTWIYFGILHFIAVASLAGLLFIRLPHIALTVGIVMIVLWNMGYADMHWLYQQTAPLLHLPKHTEDLVPFIPWFGVVLIGIYLGNSGFYRFRLPEYRSVVSIAFLGRHALLIYLVHQPILFSLTYLAAAVI